MRWTVGYPPGGATDIVARIMGQWLSERMGKQFIIENKPGAGNNLGTEAVVTMPRTAIGSLWIRSSYSRKGVLAAFGKVDAGFSGNLTVGAFNANDEPLEIPIGDRFCQLVLHSLLSPPQRDYSQTGQYQNQRGVTLAK